MKVVIVSFEYPPNIAGGIGAFNFELANRLSKYVKVVVIAGGVEDKVCNCSGIKVYYLKTPNLRPRAFYFHLYNSERIAKIIEKEKPDVIQLNDGYNFFLKLLKNARKGSVIQVFHGAPSPFNRLYYDLKMFSPSSLYDIAWSVTLTAYDHLAKLAGLSLEYINAAVHVAKHVMYYNLNYGDKILRRKVNVVIYPGLDIEALHKIKLNVSRNNTRRKLLVYGARLVPYKGVLHLLKAFELAYKEDRELELHIFGDGPLRLQVLNIIKRLMSKGVKGIYYHGKVPREEFLKNVATSKALVHSSFYEASPMVVIEAAMLGIPVLAHRAPYSEEFVKGLNIGYVANVENVEEFSDAIVAVTNDENLLQRLRESYKKLQEIFDIDKVVMNYMQLYRKLVG